MYKLLRTIPDTDDDVNSLKILRDMTEGDEVDFWNGIKVAGMPVDMAVSPDMHDTLVALLEDVGLSADVAIEDLQVRIDEQRQPPSLASRLVKRDVDSIPSDAFDYTVYHNLSEINVWMDDIATANPNIVSKIEPGISYEGRVISALKIGRASPSGTNKPVVWLQAGIHAREWIAPATLIYMANELVSSYGSVNTITELLNGLDIYIIPVLNVDGYNFTWIDDRLWRKTRSQNSECIGVDPNRNYDWHWGERGADSHPCNMTYAGPRVKSEVEIRSVTDYMSNLVDTGVDIRGFFDFHSYGQTWMSPWAYTDQLPDDFEDQNNLLAEAIVAVEAVHGTNYTYGAVANAMYIASGSSVDWTYGELGIIYSYVVELSDKGHFGFTLPPRFIEPTATETFEGLKVVLKHIFRELFPDIL